MENKSHAFWAGLFTIALTLAIAGAVFWFNVDRAVRIPYDLIARTNVTGLFPDAAVRYRGLDVGKVQSIGFDRSRPGQIRIRIMVDKDAPITQSTFGSLGFQGVTGIAFVQLDDTGTDLSPLPSSAKAVAQIPMHPSLFDQIQQRGDVLLRQFELAAKSANELMSPEMREQLRATAESLQHAADGAATLSKQLGPAVAALPGTMHEVNRAMASANTLLQPNGPLVGNLNKAGTAAEHIGDALNELNARVQYDTLPRFNALAASVGDASRQLKDVAGELGRNPRSLLFGAPGAAPGPGEAGFVWPGATAH
ncbi:ABC transporter substrate-binding protein [Burkholderia ubonensis]|uniref:ABC transporter substrate-binding protein n=1 Tax=Burkholderia ubonensis TaxID=101571 RepID=A0AAU8UUU3_9BURK|nr:MlaD family protein [Burkholderia ubonensis]AOK24629.1 ABC transporter substrate-binding protein [Burkholderia ubonensis]KVD36886.1 ABC transporter substrate-binding protein [Burkholderia ubonensis]KVM61273.1 ABC transporter substrate-binding protein [Burkholderia ubonensis]KVN30270.1 ABC transporter substrate-binding protein [Burkholderia ubonensis]KVN71692.1 ABC transporter substrate-binding protein [Burkholderia ubonensis]